MVVSNHALMAHFHIPHFWNVGKGLGDVSNKNSKVFFLNCQW